MLLCEALLSCCVCRGGGEEAVVVLGGHSPSDVSLAGDKGRVGRGCEKSGGGSEGGEGLSACAMPVSDDGVYVSATLPLSAVSL